MHEYHCQIAALPELAFDPLNKSVRPGDFLNEISPYLYEAHLNWLNMLMMAEGHKSILEYFRTGTAEDETAIMYNLEWLDPESEHFNLLPAYLQKFSAKYWKKESDPGILEMSLLDEYYRYLRQSGNGFIEKWAALELNIRNYLTAKKCEEFSISKQTQLVGSSESVERLIEFPTLHKEVQIEWPLASVLDKTLENDNLLKREIAIDQLKWDLIDEMNLFNYFSIEIILGYTIKLLILNRWNKVYLSEETTSFEKTCEKIWTRELEKNPI